jgi:hypothetical protein
MDKGLVALAASSPFLACLLWAGWWFISDAFRERRRARAVARMALRYRDRPRPNQNHDQDRHGQAPAA